MLKVKLDNKQLRVGQTTFNKESLKGMTKTEFEKRYSKILDAKQTWPLIEEYTKNTKAEKAEKTTK